uniref:Transmembrane protein 14C n=1 Tax=Sus scrofa TaxID=9823 RepID=A0A8D1CA45_PIG
LAPPHASPRPRDAGCARRLLPLAPPLRRRGRAATFPAGPQVGDSRFCVLVRRCRPSGSRVPLHWIGFGYAALVASGGIIGYAKAGSVPSLAAGLLFGGLAGLGAYQLSQDPRNIWVFLVTSGTLAGIMGMRFYHSGKFMPAGLIAGASLLMVAKLGISVLSKPHP